MHSVISGRRFFVVNRGSKEGERAMRYLTRLELTTAAAAVALFVGWAPLAMAYDGTKCRAPGNCWEPKPGYPDKIAGSKYDPRHDPMGLSKQAESIKAMEER